MAAISPTDGVVSEFLAAYSSNTLREVEASLSPSIALSWGAVDTIRGTEDLYRTLALPRDDFDVSWSSISNRIEVRHKATTYVYLLAHHMHAYEDDGVVYPLSYGGRYEFIVDPLGRLESVGFAADYVSGNTRWLPAGWDLLSFGRANPASSSARLRSAVSAGRLGPVETAYAFLWALDTGDEELLLSTASGDIRIDRDLVGIGSRKAVGLDDLLSYQRWQRDYYQPAQHSIVMTEVALFEDACHIRASHLNPGNLGNMHLTPQSKYALFFTASCEMALEWTSDHWRVNEMVMRRQERVESTGAPLIDLSRSIAAK